jgi:PIN domain nuclease of toxin-antitoxin system
VGTLLDAYALVAFLAGETAAPDVRRLLESHECAIPVVNLAEAGQSVIRRHAMGRDQLEAVVASLPLAVVPLSEAHAWRAAELRARHYQRRESDVSLADCVLVSVATRADRVATADPGVLRMAEAEGVATVELPRP